MTHTGKVHPRKWSQDSQCCTFLIETTTANIERCFLVEFSSQSRAAPQEAGPGRAASEQGSSNARGGRFSNPKSFGGQGLSSTREQHTKEFANRLQWIGAVPMATIDSEPEFCPRFKRDFSIFFYKYAFFPLKHRPLLQAGLDARNRFPSVARGNAVVEGDKNSDVSVVSKMPEHQNANDAASCKGHLR